MLTLDREAPFEVEQSEQFFAYLPQSAAVVVIEPRADLTGTRPLLLRTANLHRRLRLLLGPADPASKRINLRDYASCVRFRLTGSAFEQMLVQWQQARALWPEAYRDRLRLRPPVMLRINLANAYPRASVTRRIGATGIHFGPFAARRNAEAFLNAFLDLFHIRRCHIAIHPDPSFPGCIYSDMKMCLAPCFGGCTQQAYAAEVNRAARFLTTGGASLSDELVRERELASSELDFEKAAALHRRLEKAGEVRHTVPEMVRSLNKLNAVVLQRSTEKSTVAIFVVIGGRISDPFLLHFAALASHPRSVEEILRDVVERAAGGAREPNQSSDEAATPGESGEPAA